VAEIIWMIWNIRNKRIFNNIRLTREEAIKKWEETISIKLETEKTLIKIEDKKKKRIEMQKDFNKKWKKNNKQKDK